MTLIAWRCPCAATSALETLQQLVKEQNQALAKLKVQTGEATANARRLQDRCDTADRFAALLRCAHPCPTPHCPLYGVSMLSLCIFRARVFDILFF